MALTEFQAMQAMIYFLNQYYEQIQSEDVAVLLGSLTLLGLWMKEVNKVSIQKRMNELFESKIVSYSMDILENKLKLELELLANEVIKRYKVEFMDISTFYFINNTTDERKKRYAPEEDDYLELTSINLSNSNISISLDCKEEIWLKQYDGCGTVLLEIWSKLVVLEAKKLKVNGDVYSL